MCSINIFYGRPNQLTIARLSSVIPIHDLKRLEILSLLIYMFICHKYTHLK